MMDTDTTSSSELSDGDAQNHMDTQYELNYDHQFTLHVGRVRASIEGTSQKQWMWKAIIEDDEPVEENVSGTIFDAIMGAIEAHTGGEI